MMKCLLVVMFLMTIGAESDEDYIDPVIDMLLNGVSDEIASKDFKEEPVFTGGIWKCGNCTDLGPAQLVHVNQNDSDEDAQDIADVEVSLTLERMRCVTVASDRPGAVKKVVGSCGGSSATLSMSPAHNYTIFVYN